MFAPCCSPPSVRAAGLWGRDASGTDVAGAGGAGFGSGRGGGGGIGVPSPLAGEGTGGGRPLEDDGLFGETELAPVIVVLPHPPTVAGGGSGVSPSFLKA